MKEFVEPKLTVQTFSVEDIITMSTGGNGGVVELPGGGVVLPSDELP